MTHYGSVSDLAGVVRARAGEIAWNEDAAVLLDAIDTKRV